MIDTTSTGILMVGLDAAGKTTILYKLKLGEIPSSRIRPLHASARHERLRQFIGLRCRRI